MRQIEPGYCRLGCELHGAVGVQALDDDRLRWRDGIGMLSYARDDPVAAPSTVQITVRNRTVQLQTAVGGVDPGGLTLHIHRSQEFFNATRDDLFDGSQPSITRVLRQLHLQAIAVHDPLHLIWRDEHTILHPLHAQKAIAGAVGAYDAFNYAAYVAPSARLGSTAFAVLCSAGAIASARSYFACRPNARTPRYLGP